MNTHKLH